MRRLVPLVVLLLTAGMATAADAPVPVKDTDRVLQLVATLERIPLGPEAPDQRRWLLKWVEETKDVTVTVCEILGPLPSQPLPNGPELMVQQLFGNVAYQLRNPGERAQLAMQLAGVESTLKAYAAIVSVDPTARIAHFDELLKAQQAGVLRSRMAPVIAKQCGGA